MKKLYPIPAVLFAMLVSKSPAQTTGDSLFNDNTVHSIFINFSQGNFWTLLVNNKAYDDANDSSTYIPATVIIDGKQLDSVGIQFKGNSSYYNYPSNKKPFTLSFDEYDTLQRYNGEKSINLNNFYQDPSFMREKLFLDFLNAKGLYSPRANYSELYINGTYWGLYLMVERIDKTYLKDRFGNSGGNLFKGDGNGAACANLEYHGVMSPFYNCYTLKTNKAANDWSDLINLTYQINNTTGAQFRDSVDAVLNTNSFIGSWAACNLFCNFDSYSFRFQHNYYVYHNSFTEKFDWITWDVSTVFGMDIPMSVQQIENLSVLYITPPSAEKPLSMRMLADSIYKDTYLKYVCSFANVDFLPSVLFPKIDTLYGRIKNFVYADTLKMFSDQNFDNNINQDITVNNIEYAGLKPFIGNRSASALNELSTLGYTDCPAFLPAFEETDSYEDGGIFVSPNPFSSQTTFRTNRLFENATLTVYNSFGQTVKQINNIEGPAVTLLRERLPEGMYFVGFSQNNLRIATKKVLIAH